MRNLGVNDSEKIDPDSRADQRARHGYRFRTHAALDFRMCQTFDNTTVCDSQPQNEVGWLNIFNLEHHRSKRLGKMIADDQCTDARRYALEKGDFR